MKTVSRHDRLRAELGDARAETWERWAERTAAPDRSLAALSSIAHVLRRPAAPERELALARVLGSSPFLARLLGARPALVRWLLHTPGIERTASADQLTRAALVRVRHTARANDERLQRRLRRFKYAQLARIALRDVGLSASVPELGDELAHLADALIRAALVACEAELEPLYGRPEGGGFAVLGLGKLGGGDLNFSSDVDLVYVYRDGGATSGGERGALPQSQYFTNLGSALTRALSESTADGFLFRVDLNLRPQGRAGPIVCAVPTFLQYYETLGRTWERSALVKARWVAGDEAVANEALEGVRPFVWRRSLDLSVVDNLRDMKAQIDLRGRASVDDVKLGPGGIREVEFFVSALQLLHGGKDAPLRERGTRRALRRLARSGYLPEPQADALEEAYQFLRRVENRLQLVEERQTHALPQDPDERVRLARGLGYPDEAAFSAELERQRAVVQHHFSEVLGRTARGELPDEPLLALALDPAADAAARVAAFQQRGFADGERALGALERLFTLRDSPFGVGAVPELSGLRLLSEVADAADPDQALFHLASFLGRLKAPQGYLSMLSRSAPFRRRLLNLFGQSDYLSRSLMRSPALLDAMLDARFEEGFRTSAQIAEEVQSRAASEKDPEGRLALLRRVKNEHLLRIGMADLADEVTVTQVAEQLSALADAIVTECVALAWGETQERFGPPLPEGQETMFAVLGMGKLGGEELGYHSDLDLIFVFRGDGQAESVGGSRGRASLREYFARVAQRTLAFLQLPLADGPLYRIDARLRPSGNQGTLVVSEAALVEHHEKRAQLWERQALVKARPVAGASGPELRGLQESLTGLVYERPLPPDSAAEIRRMRERMEREVGHEDENEFDPKAGRGGLVDIEFAVQYLQLVHGGHHAGVRTPNTLAALAALATAGLLDPAHAETLRRGYLFHRRLETRLRVVHGQPLGRLPTRGRPLALLARRLGFLGANPGASLLAEYHEQAERVRAAYQDVLGSAP